MTSPPATQRQVGIYTHFPLPSTDPVAQRERACAVSLSQKERNEKERTAYAFYTWRLRPVMEAGSKIDTKSRENSPHGPNQSW